MQIEFGLNSIEFHRDFFEKHPFLRKASFDPTNHGWHLIDTALSHQDPGREMLKVVKGDRIEPEHYVEEFMDIGIRRRRIRKDKLYELIAEGATIVLNRIELVSEPVRDICMQVGRLAGAQTAANAYASIGGEPATAPHWDTHDVFVVQLAGKKNWRIYEPSYALPISSQASKGHLQDMPTQPFLEVDLEAGDILYVPRGWWHEVTPLTETDTIHLAVGIHAPLMLDYIIWACGNLLPNHLEMRKALLGMPEDKQVVNEAIQVLAKTLCTPQTLENFYARSKIRERIVTPFQIGRLISPSGPSLHPNESIRLNSRSIHSSSKTAYINGTPIPLGHSERAIEQHIVTVLAKEQSLSIQALHDQLPEFGYRELEIALKSLALKDIVQIIA